MLFGDASVAQVLHASAHMQTPYMDDLATLMPTHHINISETAVGLLALSVPEMVSALARKRKQSQCLV